MSWNPIHGFKHLLISNAHCAQLIEQLASLAFVHVRILGKLHVDQTTSSFGAKCARPVSNFHILMVNSESPPM